MASQTKLTFESTWLYFTSSSSTIFINFVSTETKETHPAVHANAGEVQRVLDIVRARFPFLLLSDKNIDLIWDWLWRNEAVGGFNEHNVGVAVRVLNYAGELEHARPPAPPKPVIPPEPVEEPELLLPGQISIHADEFSLRQPEVTPAQVRDYLKRLREYNKTC